MADGKIGYSAEEMTSKIINTPILRNMCLECSDMPDTQGIYRWFIREEKLDELITLLNSLGVMTGEFSLLHISSETLRKNNDANIIRQIAQQLCTLRLHTDLEISLGIENMLTFWKTSKHAPDLFLAICDLGVKLRKVYQNAVDRYVKRKVEEGMFKVPEGGDLDKVNEFWETLTRNKNRIAEAMDAALPLAIEDIGDSLKWMSENENIYLRLNFSEAMKLTDFESAYYDFYEDKSRTAAFMPKDIVKKEVERKFKALLLNDVFEKLTDDGMRTRECINDEISAMAQDRTLRVTLRYVQAFFMFFREDANRARTMAQKLQEGVKNGSLTYGDQNILRFPN